MLQKSGLCQKIWKKIECLQKENPSQNIRSNMQDRIVAEEIQQGIRRALQWTTYS